MAWCLIQDQSKTFIHSTLLKTEISDGSMGQLAGKGFSLYNMIVINKMIAILIVMVNLITLVSETVS